MELGEILASIMNGVAKDIANKTLDPQNRKTNEEILLNAIKVADLTYGNSNNEFKEFISQIYDKNAQKMTKNYTEALGIIRDKMWGLYAEKNEEIIDDYKLTLDSGGNLSVRDTLFILLYEIKDLDNQSWKGKVKNILSIKADDNEISPLLKLYSSEDSKKIMNIYSELIEKGYVDLHGLTKQLRIVTFNFIEDVNQDNQQILQLATEAKSEIEGFFELKNFAESKLGNLKTTIESKVWNNAKNSNENKPYLTKEGEFSRYLNNYNGDIKVKSLFLEIADKIDSGLLNFDETVSFIENIANPSKSGVYQVNRTTFPSVLKNLDDISKNGISDKEKSVLGKIENFFRESGSKLTDAEREELGKIVSEFKNKDITDKSGFSSIMQSYNLIKDRSDAILRSAGIN